MSPLRWTCKSTRQLAETLRQRGHQVSLQLVADLLHAAGYSLQAPVKNLQAPVKRLEGGNTPIALPNFTT